MNIFGSYNYAYRINLNHLFLDRNFYTDAKVFNGKDVKDNYSKLFLHSHTARFGTDYYAGKNTVIGFIVNGNFNRFRRTNKNESIVINPMDQPVNTFETDASNKDRGSNWVANINLKHTFDTTGRELTADVDYAQYDNKSMSRTATSYYQMNGQPLQPDYILDGNQRGNLELMTAKADYSQRFLQTGKMEAGFKLSFVTADNDAKFWDMSSGTPVNDVNKTNHFYYQENNNAAYLNFQKRWGKWDLQTGLRAEQTNIDTRQAFGDVKWDSSYLQFFPSAFLNYQLAEEKTLGFSVSRRIDRPGYNQLNPFLFLIDVTTYATGRPGLLPQLTWSYELSYTVKGININFGYSHTKNNQNIAIARFADVFPDIPSDDNVTVQIPINLKSSDYYGVSIAAPVRITQWWNMLNNGNFYYEKYNGQLGITQLNRGRPVAEIQTNNTFTFKKGWSAELTANLNTGNQYGFMIFDPQWALGVGAQKNILKNKGTLRFSFTDIFWTNLPKAVITYDNYVEKWNAKRETRVATLSFSYRFGGKNVLQARRRALGSDEERRRAN
ncbi:MAG: outer membrane beta-barrel family protein [Chitinophagaceae bacterium]|nr:outer membrane beta-barrel family protein [Chitinophagaceae bacterium]